MHRRCHKAKHHDLVALLNIGIINKLQIGPLCQFYDIILSYASFDTRYMSSMPYSSYASPAYGIIITPYLEVISYLKAENININILYLETECRTESSAIKSYRCH